jgi:hypothetical protein
MSHNMNLTIIFAVVILIPLALLVVWRTMRIKKAARNIVRRTESAFQENHVFSRVQAWDYPWLAAGFYDQARQEAEANGFSWLDDIEDKTLSQVYPNLRTFVRILLGPDYRTRLAIFEIVPGGPEGKPTQAPVQTRELISELSDGASVITTTAQTSKRLDPPPGLVRCHVPADTPLNMMLGMHQQATDNYLNTHSGVSLEEIRDFDQATAAWQKGIDRQRARLQAQGGISREEMLRIGGKGKEKLAIAVHRQMSKIKQDK